MKQTVYRFAIGVGLFFTALGAGCINLEPQPDPTRYFVLNSAPVVAEDPPPAGDRALRLGFKRVDLPSYIGTNRIATRRGANEIVYSDFNRWGEKLDLAVGRILSDNVRALIAVERVSVFPWDRAMDHDYIIKIRIFRFEGSDGGRVHLESNWDIFIPGSDLPVKSGISNFDRVGWNGEDYGALTALLSESLIVLSRDIAVALQKLELSP